MLCYLLFPVSNLAAELAGSQLWRSWIDVAWVGLAIAAVIRHAAEHKGAKPELRIGPGLALASVAMIWLAWSATSGEAPSVTAAMEAKPFFYLLIALLFTRAFGLPTQHLYCRFGTALAIVLLIETVARSALAGTIVRPVGSGEVNYDAALLCLSLVFALSHRELTLVHGPVIFLGLLVSFSRTSLLAASGVLLFASTIPTTLRLVMAGMAASAGIMSFVVRGLELGVLENMDRYWMWAVGVEYLLNHAWSHAAGVVPGAPIDVDIPQYLADLWLAQQERLNVDGIFPFHFHAMWLRLAIGWGWGVAALIALWLAYQAFVRRFRSQMAQPYGVAFLVFGLTMGLLYLSNVAVPYLLALNSLLLEAQKRRQLARSRSRAQHIATKPPLGLVHSH